jgi:D-alanyl-D-alanine carboxypeptidase (penicillin-binding protein 5/6)
MKTKHFLVTTLAAGALLAGSASFAAKPAKKAHAPAAAASAAAPVGPTPTSIAGNAPVLAAKSWLLMDFDSGEILASANPDEPLPPASLTQMMTSYLAEQALKSG